MTSRSSLRNRARRTAAAALGLGMLAVTAGPAAPAVAADPGPLTSYVVRADGAALTAVEAFARDHDGRVVHSFAEMGMAAVEVPAGAVARLRALPGVAGVTPNAKVRLMGKATTTTTDASATYSPGTDANSLYNIEHSLGVRQAWSHTTGAGVDVAVLDSGVAPVSGLSGRIINGPDLTPEVHTASVRYNDTYGHGTHIAGIIAGKDPNVTPTASVNDPNPFLGIAPGSRIVSVKVADAHGGTDVSQIIAGLYWVTQHAKDPGLNIRVVNLSFGTDSTQAYTIDPLAHAAEFAWRKGLVVVVSAGNSGDTTGRLSNPATDPYVLAVGAGDTRSTTRTDDDVIPTFSQRGDGTRNPDLSAPGVKVPSLRVPGSYLDLQYPAAATATRFFRGSGTSQSAAVVSGVAALLLAKRPELTPDQVKAILKSSARRLPVADSQGQGAGYPNIGAALTAPTPTTTQTWAKSTGSGSLDASRGTPRLVLDGVQLQGQVDYMGQAFNPGVMAANAERGTLPWAGGHFNDRTWAGNGFSGTNWTTATWSGNTWSGRAWTSTPWASGTWTGSGWSNGSWASSTTWKGSDWNGKLWGGKLWAGGAWG